MRPPRNVRGPLGARLVSAPCSGGQLCLRHAGEDVDDLLDSGDSVLASRDVLAKVFNHGFAAPFGRADLAFELFDPVFRLVLDDRDIRLGRLHHLHLFVQLLVRIARHGEHHAADLLDDSERRDECRRVGGMAPVRDHPENSLHLGEAECRPSEERKHRSLL